MYSYKTTYFGYLLRTLLPLPFSPHFEPIAIFVCEDKCIVTMKGVPECDRLVIIQSKRFSEVTESGNHCGRMRWAWYAQCEGGEEL
jgi:hypothetical protein